MINENKQEENLNELKNDVSNKEKNSNDDNGSLQFEESEIQVNQMKKKKKNKQKIKNKIKIKNQMDLININTLKRKQQGKYYLTQRNHHQKVLEKIKRKMHLKFKLKQL